MVPPLLRHPFSAICGLSIALVSCTTPSGEGNRPTRFVNVQPIQVCNDFGFFCADVALFEDETRKIWSQADVEIDFLSPVRLNGSRFLTIDSDREFAELSFSGGVGAFGRHPFSTRTSGPINMWFVEDISSGLFDAFGLAWIDQNGVVISDNVLAFNNGIGRLDTVAHEMGHNLGLTHSNFGAGPATNLMSDGSRRNVPSRLADITPDGARLSQLTPGQIDFARDSSLVTTSPAPSAGNLASPPLTFLPAFLDAVPAQDAVSGPLSPPGPGQQASVPGPLDEGRSPSTVDLTAAASVQSPNSTSTSITLRPRGAQRIPNGPAMSLASSSLLALGFWRHRRRS